MKNNALARRVLCSVLAIGVGGFVLPLAAQANSGLSEETILINGNKFYTGSKGAADNVVHIDSDLDLGVIGGYAEKGDATGNSISMNGGSVTGTVYGGYTAEGAVTDNSVSMSGGTVKGVVNGGYTADGDATGNRVSMSGGAVEANNALNYGVNGGYTEGGDATGNSVSMNGGTVKGDVIGGVSVSGDATGNRVSLSGGTVRGVYGGCVEVYGSATGNRVSLSGGTVTGAVYGGYVVGRYGVPIRSDVTGNSITLSGTADVSRAALYGGYLGSGNGTVENNKLIIDGWSGKVQSLNNFNGDEGGIEVKALAGGLDLAVGQLTAFVTSQKEISSVTNELITMQATEMQAGVALTVSGDIVMGSNSIYIDVASVRASDQTAITTESRAAAAAFVNQGAAVVADSISSLQNADAGISTFATVSGNNSKYDTGSYVDINGWNSIIGVANTKDLNAGKFSYGAFFENGSGNYNTITTLTATPSAATATQSTTAAACSCATNRKTASTPKPLCGQARRRTK